MKSNTNSASTMSRLNVISPVHHSHSHRSTYGWCLVERPRAHVVEHDQDDQQDRGRDPRRVEEVREVGAVERQEQVVPGRERHARTSCWACGSRTARGVPEYAMADAILGRTARRRAPPLGPAARPGLRAVDRADGRRRPGASPAVSREPGGDRVARPGPAGARRRDVRDRRHARVPRRARASRSPSVSELTQVPPLRRRPGQDLPSRGLRRHPRPARRARAAGRARGAGHRPDRPRRRQRQAVRPGGRGASSSASTRRSR